MDRQAQLCFDAARQPPGMYLAVAFELPRDEGHHFGPEFVGAFGSALFGKKPAQPFPGKGCFGLIEGRTRQAEQGRGFGL
jgi:hypothetical protein